MSETYPSEIIETSRVVRAAPGEVFAVLSDPWGHVAIDASGTRGRA